MKFYKCDICQNILTSINDNGVIPVCCGKQTELLVPNIVDASLEKHVPVINKKGNLVTVTIGETLHPSQLEHYIEWIILETDKGTYQRNFKPFDKPEVTFVIQPDETVLNAYCYCNLHYLWGKEYAM